MHRAFAKVMIATAFVAVGVFTGPTAPASASVACLHDAHTEGTRLARARVATASVLVYGDSLTFQSRDLLPSTWGYDAKWGRRTAETVQVLLHDMHARRTPPRVVVMAIGTNDIRKPRAMEHLVHLTRRLVPRSTVIVWVNTYVRPSPGWAGLNRVLASVSGVHVADWARVNVRASHGDLLDGGGVHTTCRGAHARTNLMVRTVDAWT